MRLIQRLHPLTDWIHPSVRRPFNTAIGLAMALFLSACATSIPTTTPPQASEPSAVPMAATAPSKPVPNLPIAKAETVQKSVEIQAPMAPLETTTEKPIAPPSDVWDRIRRGFAMPDLDNNLVRDREEWYSSRPDYMLRMTERSRPYLFHVVEELERRKMPTELALLPFIESAFNPQAVSSAKAAGMWQFMPATGKFFDLKQNLFRDDRRDVLESTRAALDYLQRLYAMFGDWHLALAAYNWGEGSVGRALARNKANSLPLTYEALSMPNETRYYVPKLQAVKNIVAQPASFGAQLPLIQNNPFFKTVPIEKDIDVAIAVRLAEVSLQDFKALNPSMKYPVILAAGTPKILLPWDNASIFERNLLAHAKKPLATWTAWQASKTMKPEEAARLVNMPVEQLRSVNNIPHRMLIKAGSALMVQRKGSLDNDVTEHLAENAQLGLAPEVTIKRISVKVRKTDTMSSIATRHGVSTSNLAEWNGLKPNSKLVVGKSLTILVPLKITRTASRTMSPKTSVSSSKRTRQTKP